LILIIVSYILRACPIAGKYSTFPKNKIRKLKKKRITYKEIEAELMLIGWFNQKPYVMEMEISATMKRQEIDDTLFKISFLAPISKTADEAFKKIEESHTEYYSSRPAREFRKCAEDGKDIWYYDGKLIFEYYVQVFNKTDKTFTKIKLLIYVILSWGYGLSPGIIRSFEGETFHGENWVAIVGFYLNAFNSVFLMMATIMFFVSAKIDMRRRAFLLRQLGQMVSCKKISAYTDPKLLPTINITD
jgi:hypothetical protein